MTDLVLLVHPSRYAMLTRRLAVAAAHDVCIPLNLVVGLRIVQCAWMPLETEARVRRWLPRTRQGRWYRPRRYRVERVPVLGWWMDTDYGMRPLLED